MAATEQALRVNRQHMPFELDGGVAPRAAIGLIVLATDNTIEHEFRQIVPRVAGAAVFHTRILNDPDINPETLRAMESRLADCSRTLRPGERIDVVAYGCTSASMVIGPAGVAARVHEGRPDVPVTNPVSAAVAGLGAMGAKRIALLTPYIDEVKAGGWALDEDGMLPIPDGPGLGIEIDLDAVARHSGGGRSFQSYTTWLPTARSSRPKLCRLNRTHTSAG